MAIMTTQGRAAGGRLPTGDVATYSIEGRDWHWGAIGTLERLRGTG